MQTTEYITRLRAAYPINDVQLNALGICAEAGEFANLIKREVFSGKPTKLNALKEELSDTLFHIAQAADNLGITLDELMLFGVLKSD